MNTTMDDKGFAQPEDHTFCSEEQHLYNSTDDSQLDDNDDTANYVSQRVRLQRRSKINCVLGTIGRYMLLLLPTLAAGYYFGTRSNVQYASTCVCTDQEHQPSTLLDLPVTTVCNEKVPSTPLPSDTIGEEATIPRVPLSVITQRYQLNLSFTRLPQRGQTEPAWDSLLPQGLGYIRNDLVDSSLSAGYTPTTDMSVVSVFHQLHCLYTLRRAFFATLVDNHNDDASSKSDEDLEDFDFGKPRVEHAAHCFEYLRLSLMCNGDSNLEPADFSQGEYFGWDVNRQCRNYDALKAWASDRRAFDAQGFLAKGLGAHGHN